MGTITNSTINSIDDKFNGNGDSPVFIQSIKKATQDIETLKPKDPISVTSVITDNG